MRYPLKITENFLLEPILHTFGVRAESSYADVTDGVLEVQMGRWFHEKLSLKEVAQIAPSDWPWWGGLGVKIGHHGVGVVGAASNIVNIKWKSPQKMRVLLEVNAEQLWLSLEDPDGFLKALSDATGLPVSPHTPF